MVDNFSDIPDGFRDIKDSDIRRKLNKPVHPFSEYSEKDNSEDCKNISNLMRNMWVKTDKCPTLILFTRYPRVKQIPSDPKHVSRSILRRLFSNIM